MKQEWMIHRQITPQPDGQRRWDLAYQSLLKWVQTANPTSLPGQTKQEANHASSDLHPRIDPAAGADPDD